MALFERDFGQFEKNLMFSREYGQESHDIEVTAFNTWQCLDELIDDKTGLARDRKSLHESVPSFQTKPTNIGLGMLAVLGAEQLDYLSQEESTSRLRKTLHVLQTCQTSSGFFVDWYDVRNGETLTEWPPSGQKLRPFVSSVDNGWLLASLQLVRGAKPELSEKVDTILDKIDISQLYSQEYDALSGGFYLDTGETTPWTYSRELLSESRIVHHVADRLARTRGKEDHYKTFTRNLQGRVPNFSFGGSMFEHLMPRLIISEPETDTICRQHITSQMNYGKEYNQGYWGISVSDHPNKGYHEMGVGGYYESDSVITPHALFLALQLEPEAVLTSLNKLCQEHPHCYSHQYGFVDAIDTKTGDTTKSVLLLDQAMIFLSSVNFLRDNYFVKTYEATLE